MAKLWYPASSLTGGADGSLDYFDGDDLNDGDRAIVVTDDAVYFYVLDADSATTESSPDIISPDTNPGDKRWVLKRTVPFEFGPDLYTNNEVTCKNSYAFGYLNKILEPSNGYEYVYNNTILGGESNEISEQSMGDSAIVNGSNNKISGGDNCVVLSGQRCEILDTLPDSYTIFYSSIINGYRQKMYGRGEYYEYNLMGNGQKNIMWAVNNSCLLNTNESEIIADGCSILNGDDAIAYIPGQIVFSNSKIAQTGDAQCSFLQVQGETIDASVETLSADIILKYQKLWRFHIILSAMQTAGSSGTVGDSAFWEITGGIKNIGEATSSGTLQLSGEPTDGDTFTLNSTTYTFKDTPSVATDIQIHSRPDDTHEQICYCVYKNDSNISHFYFDYYDCILTATRRSGATPNSWTFTNSCSVMTMDGSGTFGGTTAGSDGTVSLVGTPQGTGVPGANDRDAGAAAWSVAVTADDTNKSLKIAVTGEVDKTIHWVAKVSLVEVG